MNEEQQEVKTEVTTEEIVVSTELKNIIEALIFASDEPMTVRFIRSIMDDVNKDRSPAEQYAVNAEIIRKAVGDLNRGYGRMGSGFRIIEIAGGFTYATQEQFSMWVGKLAKEKARRRLSPTAVETLAIIAYKQPIAKGEVEFIRGVNVDYIINALLEKDLIHITGRANTPGRPLLYGTTQKFLEHFGLNEISDLPKPREISELISETELEVDRRLLAEQQELEFKQDLESKLEGNEGSKNKPQKASKVKVPDEVKAENRRAEKQHEAKDQASVPQEEQNIVEGEILSESNLATDETTVVTEIVPANEAVILESEPEIPTIGELENQVQSSVHSEENQEIHLVAKEVHSEENEQPNLITEDPVDPTIDLQENLETHSENRVIENVQTISMEDAAAHSESLNESEQQDQPQDQQGTGWSKWKNKVKTFFRKLFA